MAQTADMHRVVASFGSRAKFSLLGARCWVLGAGVSDLRLRTSDPELQTFFKPSRELRGRHTVGNAMIVANAEGHHRTDHDLPRDSNWTFFDCTNKYEQR